MKTKTCHYPHLGVDKPPLAEGNNLHKLPFYQLTMKKWTLALAATLMLGMASAQPFKKIKSLGDLTRLERKDQELTLTTTHGTLRVIVYSPNVIRLRNSVDNTWDDVSYAVVSQPMKTAFKVDEQPSKIVVSTDSMTLEVTRKPVRVRLLNKKGAVVNEDEPAFGTSWIGDQVTTYKKMQQDERFIGLGEKTGPLNRRGEGYTNWNTDNYGYASNADPLYTTLPFYIGVHSGVHYGLFMDNSYKSHFNFGASNDRFASFTAEDGEMNYYLIHHGTVAKTIESYTWLTGRMAMPPLWALGLQQSRYSYYPDTEVETLAKTYRDKGIPADAIVLDIHYMDKYKIWTWDPKRFSNPKGMVDKLKSQGFKTVVIIDPGIKKEPGYKAYDEGVKEDVFLKYPDGTYYSGQVWPGWCHFPDFTMPKARKWWGDNFKDLVNTGVEGFWNDMNEIATWGQRSPDNVEFDLEGNRGTHRKGRNVYGLNMVRSTYEGTKSLMNKRPFILTRSGYSGIQRYSAVWTGDNVSTDDHMLTGIRLVNSMGLTGVPFTGMDVGGFAGGGPSKELFGRWMSVGAFTPFYRIHIGIDSKESDPWSYGERIEAISTNYIKLRYKLLPYLYSSFYHSSQTGAPINRSLAVDYTHDGKVYDGRYQNQYFFGQSGLMVCPSESYKELTRVYLPEATGWYDFYNDTYFPGAQEMIVESPVEKLPLFVRGGSILTTQSLVMHTGQRPTDTLVVHVYNGTRGSSSVHYEDDGVTYDFEKGSYHRRNMTLDPAKRNLRLTKAEGSMDSKFRFVKVIAHGFPQVKGGKDEEVSFVEGLPHFDPVGEGKRPPFCKVKSLVVPLQKGEMTISW